MTRLLSVLLLTISLRVAVGDDRIFETVSPQHPQTFSFGSEEGREWIQRGDCLALVLHLTNDPYVDRVEPRQYDDFEFDFPDAVLGGDRRTFYLRHSGGLRVPIAEKRTGILGSEVRLCPSSKLIIDKPHGLLTVTLLVARSNSGAGK